MKKYILSAILLTTGFFGLQAADRTTDEMKAIALQQLVGAGVKGVGTGQAIQLTCFLENPSFAIYGPQGGNGFVIVSRDDAERPVLGYSTGNFNADNIPCCMQWWMKQVTNNLQARRLSHKAPVAAKKYEPVAPMLTTKWGQGEPYNRKTPTFNGKHAPTGCVATAMAQILNYNQYPASAHFNGFYYDETPNEKGDNYKTAEIQTTYSYPYGIAYDAYLPDGYTDEKKDALPATVTSMSEKNKIATLMRDCGYASVMQYTENGSGTSLAYAYTGLKAAFQYPTQALKYRDIYNPFDEALPMIYTTDEWLQFIVDDLHAGSPVLYGGQDEELGGHAFVFHGLNEDGLVYVNWGWQGSFDGYYAVDVLDTPDGNFASYASMVTGIRSIPLATDCPTSLFISNQVYSFSKDDTGEYPFLINFPGYCICYMEEEFNGNIFIVYEDLTDGTVTYEDYLDEPEGVQMQMGYGWEEFSGYGITELKPNHTYRMYMASHTVGEIGYSPIRVPGGRVYCTATVDSEGVPTFSEPQIMPTAVKEVAAETPTQENAATTYVYDIQGRLIQSVPTAQFNQQSIPGRGLVIVKQGNQVRKVIR